MQLDTYRVTPCGTIDVRYIRDDGGHHREVLYPGQDVSDRPQALQDAAAAAWTDDVIAAYRALAAT